MNLENLGLVELNAREVQEVEGGTIWLGPSPGYTAHTFYDFFHGVWNGIVGRE